MNRERRDVSVALERRKDGDASAEGNDGVGRGRQGACVSALMPPALQHHLIRFLLLSHATPKSEQFMRLAADVVCATADYAPSAINEVSAHKLQSFQPCALIRNRRR